MSAEVGNPPSTCPQCGALLGRHRAGGYCGRCLAETSLFDESLDSSDEEALRALLPGSLADRPLRQCVGEFEIVEEVARGGMGVVFKARQTSLDRIVAFKMMLFGGWGGPEMAGRFRTEAVAAAGLDHPNIVRVFQVGEHDGLPFIAMQYIAGQNLAAALRDGPLGACDAAECLCTVARAVQFAHDHGVLHRDLKPSNILLDANGTPYVTDFGLAKLVAGESNLTITGQALGSPNYAPPEQAASTGEVDTRSDIYALGAILYHALTGRPPFQGHSLADVLVQARERSPVPPRQLDPGIPRDLETICLKCLEKEPAKRYPTAQQMAEDLDRFLQQEPIRARPVNGVERVWRWCRRKPALAASVAFSLSLLLAVLIGSPIAVYRFDRERQRATTQAYASDMNVVSQAWDEGNLRRAQSLLRKYIPSRGERDLRGFEWRYLWKLCQDQSQFSFTNFSGGVNMALSIDGRIVAAASGKEIRILDYANQRESESLRVPKDSKPITGLAFLPTDTNVLATVSDQTLRFWDLAGRRVARTLVLSNAASALAFSRDGKLLAAAGAYDETVELWRVQEQSFVGLHHVGGPVFALAFAPDGDSLIHGGGGGSELFVWDLVTGASASFPSHQRASIGAIAFSPNGRVLATSANDATVVLWDFAQRKAVARLSDPGSGSVGTVAFSPDGGWLATGNNDGTVRLWNIKGNQEKAILYRGHRSEVLDVAFSADGRRIISSSADGSVKVWSLDLPSVGTILTNSAGWVRTSLFFPDSKRIVTRTARQGGLKVWDVATRSALKELPLPFPDASGPGGISPDGKKLVLVSDRRIALWDASTFATLGLWTNDFAPHSLSFAPDGRILAVSGSQSAANRMLDGITNRLAFWDINTRQKIHKLQAAAPLAMIVKFSNDGRKVAIGYLHGEVRVWDYKTERPLAEFTDQQRRIWALAFSPDDLWLVAGDGDGVVAFHNLRTRERLPSIQTSAWCLGLCFTPDGKTLASGNADGTVRLWNVATRDIALTLKGHIGQVSMDLSFSPDGKYLTTCGADGTVRLWPAAVLDEFPRFKAIPR